MARTSVNVKENSRNIVITEGENSNINVTQKITDVVSITAIGPQGSKGDTGPRGPKGEPGELEAFEDLVVTGSLFVSGGTGNGEITASLVSASGGFIGLATTSSTSIISSSRDVNEGYYLPLYKVIGDNYHAETDSVINAPLVKMDKSFFSHDYNIKFIPQYPVNPASWPDSGISGQANLIQIGSAGGPVGGIQFIGGTGGTTFIRGYNSNFVLNAGGNNGRLVFTSTNTIHVSQSIEMKESTSLIGTASFADDATSASFATTASFALNVPADTGFPFTGSAEISGSLDVVGPVTASSITSSLTGELLGTIPANTISASGNISASAFYGDGSNLTGTSGTPFPFTGDAQITGSLIVTGSTNVIGSLTASFLQGDASNLTNVPQDLVWEGTVGSGFLQTITLNSYTNSPLPLTRAIIPTSSIEFNNTDIGVTEAPTQPIIYTKKESDSEFTTLLTVLSSTSAIIFSGSNFDINPIYQASIYNGVIKTLDLNTIPAATSDGVEIEGYIFDTDLAQAIKDLLISSSEESTFNPSGFNYRIEDSYAKFNNQDKTQQFALSTIRVGLEVDTKVYSFHYFNSESLRRGGRLDGVNLSADDGFPIFDVSHHPSNVYTSLETSLDTTFNSPVTVNDTVSASNFEGDGSTLSNVVSNPFNDDLTITGSLLITGSTDITGSITASRFKGDGRDLYNVPQNLAWDGTVKEGKLSIISTTRYDLSQQVALGNEIVTSSLVFSSSLTDPINNPIIYTAAPDALAPTTNAAAIQLTPSFIFSASNGFSVDAGIQTLIDQGGCKVINLDPYVIDDYILNPGDPGYLQLEISGTFYDYNLLKEIESHLINSQSDINYNASQTNYNLQDSYRVATNADNPVQVGISNLDLANPSGTKILRFDIFTSASNHRGIAHPHKSITGDSILTVSTNPNKVYSSLETDLTTTFHSEVSSSNTGSFKHLVLDYDAMPSSDPGIKGVIYRSGSSGNQLFISDGA